ncbi:MAG TPA: ATP-dependent DNA ligase [Clostridiales bacterium]|nr:MAG: hypothetical protein A2Y18_06240 [Clostridiales bacterium GWD2_32_19]HCC07858.1 ATP-dependent DNA ligase [Clostridiales bacterium]
MENVFKILSDIKNTSSRNEKENILLQNIENEMLKELLEFVYNPYIVTGLSGKKINKKMDNINASYDSTINILEYLRTHNTGKDEDILVVQNFVASQPIELQKFYKQIITKDLKIGITSKTINKVFGDKFIPMFEVMLAEKYKNYKDKIEGELIVTQKLDGVRCLLIKDNGVVSIFSRQGQPIEELVEILLEADDLIDNQVYDGELLAKNTEELDSKTLYRKTVKISQSKGEKTGIEFHIFDMIPISDFQEGFSNIECWQRKDMLKEIIESNNFEYLINVPIIYKGEDKTVVDVLLEEARSKGQEGIMVSLANAPYECKRTRHLLKVKAMESVDLKVTGYEEGENKYEGMLGALIVDYKGYRVKVGGGYSDLDREEIWKQKESMIGKIIEVQYFEESENEKGGISLRFPVFKGIRDDKTEESYY